MESSTQAETARTAAARDEVFSSPDIMSAITRHFEAPDARVIVLHLAYYNTSQSLHVFTHETTKQPQVVNHALKTLAQTIGYEESIATNRPRHGLSFNIDKQHWTQDTQLLVGSTAGRYTNTQQLERWYNWSMPAEAIPAAFAADGTHWLLRISLGTSHNSAVAHETVVGRAYFLVAGAAPLTAPLAGVSTSLRATVAKERSKRVLPSKRFKACLHAPSDCTEREVAEEMPAHWKCEDFFDDAAERAAACAHGALRGEVFPPSWDDASPATLLALCAAAARKPNLVALRATEGSTPSPSLLKLLVGLARHRSDFGVCIDTESSEAVSEQLFVQHLHAKTASVINELPREVASRLARLRIQIRTQTPFNSMNVMNRVQSKRWFDKELRSAIGSAFDVSVQYKLNGVHLILTWRTVPRMWRWW